jgi:uncharacterized membrane protein
MDPKTIYFVLFLWPGLLLLLLGAPLVRGKIPPNRWYGFRVRRTLGDPSVWYAANRHAGRWMIVAGIAMIAGAATGYFVPIRPVAYAIGWTALALAVVAFAMFQSFRHLRRLPDNAISR